MNQNSLKFGSNHRQTATWQSRRTLGRAAILRVSPEDLSDPREKVIRINGADHPKLFDGIITDSVSIFSNYIRFSTDIKDVKIDTPSNPEKGRAM